jgi:hypothetical protein
MNSVVLFACSLTVGQTYSDVERPRVYVSYRNSWQMVGGFSSPKDFGGGVSPGGQPSAGRSDRNLWKCCLGVIVVMDK